MAEAVHRGQQWCAGVARRRGASPSPARPRGRPSRLRPRRLPRTTDDADQLAASAGLAAVGLHRDPHDHRARCGSGGHRPSCRRTGPGCWPGRTRPPPCGEHEAWPVAAIVRSGYAPFLEQAAEYERAGDLRDGLIKMRMVMARTHPLPVARRRPLRGWIDSARTAASSAGDSSARDDDRTASVTADVKEAAQSYREAFTPESRTRSSSLVRRSGDAGAASTVGDCGSAPAPTRVRDWMNLPAPDDQQRARPEQRFDEEPCRSPPIDRARTPGQQVGGRVRTEGRQVRSVDRGGQRRRSECVGTRASPRSDPRSGSSAAPAGE